MFCITLLQLYMFVVLLLAADAKNSITPATITSQEQGTCALEEQREHMRELIQKKTRQIIRDSVLPSLCNLPESPATCDDIPLNCSSGW